jgi:hypothetical protein
MKNLCVRESYAKDGVEKVKWNVIGTMFESNGKEYVKLFHMPGILVSVYEQKKKDQGQSNPEKTDMADNGDF